MTDTNGIVKPFDRTFVEELNRIFETEGVSCKAVWNKKGALLVKGSLKGRASASSQIVREYIFSSTENAIMAWAVKKRVELFPDKFARMVTNYPDILTGKGDGLVRVVFPLVSLHELRAEVILFKESGKYYTTESWRVPAFKIGTHVDPSDMMNSPDARRIGDGAVLVCGEPKDIPDANFGWGFPHLIP